MKTYGHLDALILNAGILTPLGKVDEVPVEGWKAHFDVNFFSLVSALRATVPVLRKSPHGGRVVFMSSGAATGNGHLKFGQSVWIGNGRGDSIGTPSRRPFCMEN